MRSAKAVSAKKDKSEIYRCAPGGKDRTRVLNRELEASALVPRDARVVEMWTYLL